MEKKRISNKTFWIIIIMVCISFVGILVGIQVYNTYADDETYTGKFITATKVYMPDNHIKLVIYFNETGDNIHFKIFDDWDARHSIQLSNMDEGDKIKIYYKDYSFRDCKEIVRIEML